MKPTVDAVRKRLGGRARSDPGVGALVTLRNGGMGIVLFVRGDDLEVWVDAGLVRRVQRQDTAAADGAIDRDLFEVASDARAFAELAEGDRVTFEQDGAPRPSEGVLVEKCRFGALVETSSGAVVGVGFRRIRRA